MDDSQYQLIDTHLHLIYRDKFKYSWTTGCGPIEHGEFSLSELSAYKGVEKVTKAIFMETGVDDAYFENETRFALQLVERQDNNICGVIGSCRPEGGEYQFDKWLEETKESNLVGFRRILHTESDELSKSELFRSNIRKIGAQGKTFDVCMLQSQLGLAYELASSCDNTQMILNHCGVPSMVAEEFNQWKQQITRLAQLDNLNCKLSGVIASCKETESAIEKVRPFLEHCIESFGAERLVWGSDWPVSEMGSGLENWFEVFQNILSSLPVDDVLKITQSNATRIYNLD